MTIAATIAAERGLQRPTAAAIAAPRARRGPPPWLRRATLPRAISSTSAPLFTVPDERRPAPRERALVVRDARIEVPRRAPQLHRHAHAPPRAPGAHALAAPALRRRSRRRRPRPARPSISSTSTLNDTPDAVTRRIGAQHTRHVRERLVVLRQQPVLGSRAPAFGVARALRTRCAASAATPRATRRRRAARRPQKNATPTAPASAIGRAARHAQQRDGRARDQQRAGERSEGCQEREGRAAEPASRPTAGIAATDRTRRGSCKTRDDDSSRSHEGHEVHEDLQAKDLRVLRALRVFVMNRR